MLVALGGGTAQKLYVDDVFSAYSDPSVTGAKTITTPLNMESYGGMVWYKQRDSSTNGHFVVDTTRGAGKTLEITSSGGEYSAQSITAFNGGGFTAGTYGTLGSTVFWSFRRAPGFCDVVAWTGNGMSRAIPHALGCSPGMAIVKRIDGAGDWLVVHRGIASGARDVLFLNSAAGLSSPRGAGNTLNISTDNYSDADKAIYLVDGSPANPWNIAGAAYVAYLFANDETPDGIVRCGSFTTDASGNANVSVGWESQFVITRCIDAGGANWRMFDTSRGWSDTPGLSNVLKPNTRGAETSMGLNQGPHATGFRMEGQNPSSPGIYLAIRRPNKPPTSGTQVYNAIARAGTGAATRLTGVGFSPDLVLTQSRNLAGATNGASAGSRLQGTAYLRTRSTGVEQLLPSTSLSGWLMDGISLAGSSGEFNDSMNGNTYINWFFRRAPGVLDVVCYTGDGSSLRNISHNLGVTPGLRITKARSTAEVWEVTAGPSNTLMYLNTNNGVVGGASSGTPTTFPVYKQSGFNSNSAGVTYVAYLFATMAGISKIGTFTGNGASQTIACGFSNGARFILIKRTDTIGDWYVWDSARGIVAGNDPHLSLNTTVIEAAADDSIDPDASGFIVNQIPATNINFSGGSYIFLAIA